MPKRVKDSVVQRDLAVVSFYKFVNIDDTATLRLALSAFCCQRGIKGTIIIANEGLNATVAGTDIGIAALVDKIRSDVRFADLTVKHARAAAPPFRRLKVKVKPEIVTFGVPDVSPAARTASSVEPEDWNALITAPDVLVVDTRNEYEVAVGTFESALDPKTRAFSDFPEFVARELSADKSRRIAMFCTGGIRCEKASAYLLREGFADVYQLRGGILNYLERIPPDRSLWQGECFVFDERVALDEGLHEGKHELCPRCGWPVRFDEIRRDLTQTRCACGRDDAERLTKEPDVV